MLGVTAVIHSHPPRLTVHFAEDRRDGLRAIHGFGLRGHVGFLLVRPWQAPVTLAARTRIPHGGDLIRGTGGTQGRLLMSASAT